MCISECLSFWEISFLSVFSPIYPLDAGNRCEEESRQRKRKSGFSVLQRYVVFKSSQIVLVVLMHKDQAQETTVAKLGQHSFFTCQD